MGGAVLGVWGSGGNAPSRRRNWGLEAEPPALEILHFFAKKNFGAILIKNNAFKTWHRNKQRNMIQLFALLDYVGSG